MRKKIEELFGEAKEFMGFRQAKYRRAHVVREQVLMTATAQNIKRMVKLLSRERPKGDAQAAIKAKTKPFTVRLSELLTSLYQKISEIRFADRFCLAKA